MIYLILTERERHAFVVASNLDIAIAKHLKSIRHGVFKLLVSLGRDKTMVALVIAVTLVAEMLTWLQTRRHWVAI